MGAEVTEVHMQAQGDAVREAAAMVRAADGTTVWKPVMAGLAAARKAVAARTSTCWSA